MASPLFDHCEPFIFSPANLFPASTGALLLKCLKESSQSDCDGFYLLFLIFEVHLTWKANWGQLCIRQWTFAVKAGHWEGSCKTLVCTVVGISFLLLFFSKFVKAPLKTEILAIIKGNWYFSLTFPFLKTELYFKYFICNFALAYKT